MALQTSGKHFDLVMERVLQMNIQSSEYYKELATVKSHLEVIDEIYNQVEHVEPWMSGNARGSSTAFCLLYKLFTLQLTVKQVQDLITHEDSSYIRAVGFLYLRYIADPKTLWDWFEPYLEDDEKFAPGTSGKMVTMGVYVRDLLLELYYFDTIFPRIPVPVARQITANLEARGLPTKGLGAGGTGAGKTGRGAEEGSRRPPSVKAALSVAFGQRAPHRSGAREAATADRVRGSSASLKDWDEGPVRSRDRSRDVRERSRDTRERSPIAVVRDRSRDRRSDRGGSEDRKGDREKDPRGERERSRERRGDRERSKERRGDRERSRGIREKERDRSRDRRDERERDRKRERSPERRSRREDDRGRDRSRERRVEREKDGGGDRSRHRDRSRERDHESRKERGRDRSRERKEERGRDKRHRSREREDRHKERHRDRSKERRKEREEDGRKEDPDRERESDRKGRDKERRDDKGDREQKRREREGEKERDRDQKRSRTDEEPGAEGGGPVGDAENTIATGVEEVGKIEKCEDGLNGVKETPSAHAPLDQEEVADV